MRLLLALALACSFSATALAAPGDPQPTSSKAPATPSKPPGTTPATPTSSKAPATPSAPPDSSDASPDEPTDPDAPQPTSSKAPTSATPTPARSEPAESKPTLSSERSKSSLGDDRKKWKGADAAFRRHGAGVRGGITVIPSWILARWFETHSNALCRGGSIGGFAEKRGIVQQGGCNFYVGGDYVYRFNRILDLGTSIGYQRASTPPGLWLQADDYDPAMPESLGSADYTEVKLGFMFIELDAIARVPIVVNENVEFGIGGGGGLGLGILFGDIYQTPLGSAPAGFSAAGGATPGSCRTPKDFADNTRCTPRWDVLEDSDMTPPSQGSLETPNPGLFATCNKTKCSDRDLQAFGYRAKQGGVPPVIPVVNLLINARVIIKDAVGIGLTGGFQTGFYFGGNLHYFFGKPKQDDFGAGPASARRMQRRSARASASASRGL